jgi:ferredoxin
MKIIVDASTCVGCGLCEQVCPDAFEMKDDGIAHVKANAQPDCAKDAVEQCPVTAIKIA